MLANASKNLKSQLSSPQKKFKHKQIVDGILHHFVAILLEFRTYDKIQIIENDTYVINKILKLAIMDPTYFQIFDKLLEDIIFIPDICKIVKISIYPRITNWFKDLKEG